MSGKLICQVCGFPNESAVENCENCGEPIRPADTGTSEPVVETPTVTQPDERPSSRIIDPPSTAQPPVQTKARASKSQPKPQQQQKPTGGKRPPMQPGISVIDGYMRIQMKVWHAGIFGTALLIVIIITIFSYFGNSDTVAPSQSAAMQQQQQHATPSLAQIDEAKKRVAENPGDPKALLALSHTLHDANMFDQAIATYKQYLEIEPGNPDARVDLGVCYYSLGRYDDAIKEMKTAIDEAPGHQLGHFNLGIVTLAKGDTAEAAEWFRKSIDIDPEATVAQNAMSLLGQISSKK